MTEFHEGQEVDVRISFTGKLQSTVGSVEIWRKAKIIRNRAKAGHAANGYEVQFPDGTRAVFDEERIRSADAIDPNPEFPDTCDMTKFREDQEVEVLYGLPPPGHKGWRKAKIIRDRAKDGHAADGYEVQFLDGTRGVFNAENIRTSASSSTGHEPWMAQPPCD